MALVFVGVKVSAEDEKQAGADVETEDQTRCLHAVCTPSDCPQEDLLQALTSAIDDESLWTTRICQEWR